MSVDIPRRPLISGNWKMNKNHFEAIQLVQKLGYLLRKEDFDAVDVSVHPPHTDLRSVQTLIEADELRLELGAQNCHWEDKGAFTGEVSPVFLAKLGVTHVICGHSERRTLFGESDADVRRKIDAVIRHQMTPIVCVGETLEERESGRTLERVIAQVRAALGERPAAQVAEMVVAYEPIWAIGTGRTATPGDAQAVIGAIRGAVEETAGRGAAARIRLQYGGSVTAGTIGELMAQPDVDGALVGGASLDPDEFARIIQYPRR